MSMMVIVCNFIVTVEYDEGIPAGFLMHHSTRNTTTIEHRNSQPQPWPISFLFLFISLTSYFQPYQAAALYVLVLYYF